MRSSRFKQTGLWFGAALILLPAAALQVRAEADVTQFSDTQFDSWFRCPESFATDDERSAAVAAYYRWAKTRHPEWTLNEIIRARVALLLRHSCEETLKTLPPSLTNPRQ